MPFLRLVLVVAVTGAMLAAAVTLVAPRAIDLVASHRSEEEDIDLTRLNSYAVRSYVYGNDGSTVAIWHGPENRSPVALAAVPAPVVEAVLAVEDADFYVHAGVNVKANVRALVENVSAGDIEQGGSTITQQLVKNALLTTDQNFDRKSREAALSLRLEEKLTALAEAEGKPDPVRAAKDTILEAYFNTVYLGSGAYGAQAAAETYWQRPVGELGWSEAALLAGLIANPVGYDPTLHPERALRRRSAVLDRLVQVGKLTTGQADSYRDDPLPVGVCPLDAAADVVPGCRAASQEDLGSYFSQEVKLALLADPKYGLGATAAERERNLFTSGIKVFTTLDPPAQRVAEDVVAHGVPQEARDRGVMASMVSVEPATGAVRVMVGGPDFRTFKNNLTTMINRGTGSSFKLFTLLTALEQGNIAEDLIAGGPVERFDQGKPWKVEGPGGTLDSVTLASSNAAFVRIGLIVGNKNVVAMAKRLGVSTPLAPDESLTLGPQGIPPIDMVSAYSALPNGGVREPYHLVERVESADGRVLYQHQASGTKVLDPTVNCWARQILQHNVASGTGTRSKLSRQESGGKTGTNEGATDTWFVGFTPYLTTAVWMGNPADAKPNLFIAGQENFGSLYPARMWHDFNEPYHEGRPPQPFAACPAPTRPPRAVQGLGDNTLNGPVPAPPDEGSPTTTVRPRPGPNPPGPSPSFPFPTSPPATEPTTRPRRTTTTRFTIVPTRAAAQMAE